MTPLSASASVVIRRRPWTRQAGACLFFVLTLLICVERRVAELDLTHDDGVLLENDDGLDGAEILDRLVGLDDIHLPQPPDLGRVAVRYIAAPPVQRVREVRIFTRTPRAPPPVRVPGETVFRPIPDAPSGGVHSGEDGMKSSATSLIYTEIGTPHETHQFGVKEVLLSKQTAFQHVTILDTFEYGKMLIIDGRTQSAEDDEHIYHECLVHPALVAHSEPRRVLIIGGGEGATLREVLRHPSIERAVMVDIDRDVVEQCQKLLPEWHEGAFDDARVELVFADGKEYVMGTTEHFDVVVVDVCDVLEDGPALALYTERFYGHVKQRLTDHGIVVVQAMELSELDHIDHVTVHRTLNHVFRHVASYATFIPSFWASWGFAVASDTVRVSSLSVDEVDDTLRIRGIEPALSHYDGQTHQHVFALPKAVRQILASALLPPA